MPENPPARARPILEPIDASAIFPNNTEIVSTGSSEDTCPICYQDMNEEEHTYTLPECNHKFHSNCIIPWFRTPNQESCPTCRSRPTNENRRFDTNTNEARYKFNRTFSYRKNAPAQLKKLVARLKKAEEINRQKNIEKKNWLKSIDGHEWKRLHKIYKSNYSRNWRRNWRIKHKTTKLHIQIAEYPIKAVPVYSRKK